MASVVFGSGKQPQVDKRQLAKYAGAAGGGARSTTYDDQPRQRKATSPGEFVSGAGTQTVEAQYATTSFFDGGPKGRKAVANGGVVVSDKGTPIKAMHGHAPAYQSGDPALQYPLW